MPSSVNGQDCCEIWVKYFGVKDKPTLPKPKYDTYTNTPTIKITVTSSSYFIWFKRIDLVTKQVLDGLVPQ